MGNPNVDNLKPAQVAVEDSKHHYDRKDAVKQANDFDSNYRVQARITAASTEYSDEYTVDLYEKGYLDTRPPQPTRTGIKAHATFGGDWFVKDDLVRVRLMPDNTAWIVHDPRPDFGVIVEAGPNGEADETGFMYWVATARVDNNFDTYPTGFVKYADDEPLKRIVRAANLSQYALFTHRILPGTVVELKWDYDQANVPGRRYFFEVQNEPDFVRVRCYKDGGSAGGDTVTCNLTYTCKHKTIDKVLGVLLEPEEPRFTKVEYTIPADGSMGLAYWVSHDDLKLVRVFKEFPKDDTCSGS